MLRPVEDEYRVRSVARVGAFLDVRTPSRCRAFVVLVHLSSVDSFRPAYFDVRCGRQYGPCCSRHSVSLSWVPRWDKLWETMRLRETSGESNANSLERLHVERMTMAVRRRHWNTGRASRCLT